jgi:hypothetical protein
MFFFGKTNFGGKNGKLARASVEGLGHGFEAQGGKGLDILPLDILFWQNKFRRQKWQAHPALVFKAWAMALRPRVAKGAA